MQLRRYQSEDAEEWNAFVAASKNGTFLHDRGFMDYHSDRFDDYSLMVEEDGALVALLPANLRGDEVFSHGGLSYGGLLSGTSMTAARMVDVVAALVNHLKEQGISTLHYKAIPHIYHRQPAEEDLYALTQQGACPVRVDLSSAIPLQRRLALAKGRKSGASKARRLGLEIREGDDFAAFWAVLSDTLDSRHGAAPVHSLDEIRLLKSRFPDKIRLFGAFDGATMSAGAVMFDCGQTAHVQYMAAAPAGREQGALDLLIKHLLDTVFADRDWFDFGISTTDGGRELNVGLSRQKEMFGARSLIFPHYRLDLK